MRPVVRASALALLVNAAALATTFVATSAGAADLPRRGPPVDYYAPPPPVFTWTGFYAGLNLGGAVGSFSQGSGQLFGSNPSGVIGGLTLGYNYQIAPQFTLGIEGDINGSSVTSGNNLPFFGFSGNARMNALMTVRGRAGYTIDRTLLYVTGGLAVASVRANISDVRGPVPFWGSQSSWQAGYTIGAGAEYAITPRLSAKAEYLYTSTGNDDYFAYTRDYTRFGVDFHTLRAGVNYHF